MPILKVITYPAKVFSRGSKNISSKLVFQDGYESNIPRGHRYSLFRILLNRNKIFFMDPTHWEVYCDGESYALIRHLAEKRGPSSITAQDIEDFKTMNKEQILEIAMPKVIADILLEEY